MNACAHCSAPLILLALLVSLAAADQKTEEVLLISASAADLISTELALGPGFEEGNHLLENRAVRIAGKAASTALILLLARHLQQDHPKLASALRFSGIAFSAGAASWNLSVTLSR